MSYQDGWAAMNLQMPKRVPHFEPSADWYHWDLIRTVTGLDVSEDSPAEVRVPVENALYYYDVYQQLSAR